MMPKSDMNRPPTDITDEVGAGDGTGSAFDHEVPEDGTKRKSSPYGPEKSGNKMRPAAKNNSSER